MGHWKIINRSQVTGSLKGAARKTTEFAEIMALVQNGGIPEGKAIRLSKMPKLPGKNVAGQIRYALNKEFQRQGLQYIAKSHGANEVDVLHL